jgi:signal transduction histidine kinase
MLLKLQQRPESAALTRSRINGITLRVLVLISAAAAAVSLLTVPGLSRLNVVLTLGLLSIAALSVWWPAGRGARLVAFAALAATAAAQLLTASPLIDYVMLALVVYALTGMAAPAGIAYALTGYLLWAILHYRTVDDLVRWLQSNLVFALPAAAAITAGYVYRRSLRRLWQKRNLLQQMQQRADDLTGVLRELQLRVAAEERRRLAQQLNDDLQAAFVRTEQQFAAALGQLQAGFERAQAGLDGARSGVSHALDRLRTAVVALRGSSDGERQPTAAATDTLPAGRSVHPAWNLLWLLPAAVPAEWLLRSLLDSAFGGQRLQLRDQLLSPLSLLGLLPAVGLVLTPLIVARVQLRRARQAERRLASLIEDIDRRIDAARRLALHDERTRLARELHDELGSQLVLINLHLQLAAALAAEDGEAARQQLAAGRSVLQRAWQSLLSLSDADLALTTPAAVREAIERLVGAAHDNTGSTITLHGLAELPQLPQPAAACVYRTVQEGLTNALKYAAGAPLSIACTVDAGTLELQLLNGPGRCISECGGGGFGILGLQERAQALGGTITAGSDSGGGWRLTLRLPLDGSSDR